MGGRLPHKILHEIALHADEPWMSEVSIGIVGFEGLPPDAHVALDVMVTDVRHRVDFRLGERWTKGMDPWAADGSLGSGRILTNVEEMVRTNAWSWVGAGPRETSSSTGAGMARAHYAAHHFRPGVGKHDDRSCDSELFGQEPSPALLRAIRPSRRMPCCPSSRGPPARR